MISTVRNILFWFLDSVRSGVVRKNYNDVKFHFYHSSTQKSKDIRASYLDNLIKHATNTVPFYSQFVNVKDFQNFPIVNKLSYKDNYDNFFSNKYKKETLLSTTTSGSTGTPFTIYKNAEKVKRHQAENIFFSDIANYKLGSKLYYTRVWNNVNKKNILERILKNLVLVEISNLSDRNVSLILEKIRKDKSNKSILGFSSVFEAIAKFIKKANPAKGVYRIDSIITMSETLPKAARSVLQEYFECSVVSRYSNMENGFIAQQFRENEDRYLVNHGSFIIEILDLEKDVPVAYGTLGRIVVTDLFNYAMPFIRYDTGDLGVLNNDIEFGNHLRDIEGRKTDFIYNTKGELLSPHTITNTMWKFNDLKQFQFIQKAVNEYTLKINYENSEYPRENELQICLKEYVGEDAQIRIEYVDEIPLLNSGKRKKVVNEINL